MKKDKITWRIGIVYVFFSIGVLSVLRLLINKLFPGIIPTYFHENILSDPGFEGIFAGVVFYLIIHYSFLICQKLLEKRS